MGICELWEPPPSRNWLYSGIFEPCAGEAMRRYVLNQAQDLRLLIALCSLDMKTWVHVSVSRPAPGNFQQSIDLTPEDFAIVKRDLLPDYPLARRWWPEWLPRVPNSKVIHFYARLDKKPMTEGEPA